MNIPKQYYIWLSLGLILLMGMEALKPKEIDWRATYSTFDKTPYGCSALFELSSDLFPDQEISRVHVSCADYIDTIDQGHTLVFIAEDIYFDDVSQDKLLEYLSRGNSAFLSGEFIDPNLLDTLGVMADVSSFDFVATKQSYKIHEARAVIDTNAIIGFLKPESYFSFEDSLDIGIKEIGFCNSNPNFISIPVGEGEIFLHLEPLLFTNYCMLRGNSVSYVEKAFLQLNTTDIIWDDYMNYGDRKSSSPLRVLLKSDSLRYAYYMAITLLLLFLVFAGKRKQKMIPVLEHQQNASLGFINTLSNLYLSHNNHKIIASHHINAFRIHARNQYFINWNDSLEVNIQRLSKKTGMDELQISNLFLLIKKIEAQSKINETELLKLTKSIQTVIYRKNGRK